MTDVRLNNLQAWLGQQGLSTQLTPLPGDAGFRRYFRLAQAQHHYIAVDAPPASENTARFLEIANWLQQGGIRVPKIFAHDARGFLLIEDLGNQLLFDYLTPQNAHTAYSAALQTLKQIQQLPTNAISLEPFDKRWLKAELMLFKEWFLQKWLQLELNQQQDQLLEHFFEQLVTAASEQIQVPIHRDFHSKNLFLMNSSEVACIDFQDAMLGPLSYDLVSLIKDCYIDWPIEWVTSWAKQFCEQNPYPLDAVQFQRDVDWMGCQRHLKALFIFTRKWLRDDNPHYLTFIPRTLAYIRNFCSQYHEVYDFGIFLEECIVPLCRRELEPS